MANETSTELSATMKQSPDDPNRYIFQFNGMKIYEWEQSLEDVTMYINAPPGKYKAADFDVQIETSKLRVGLKGRDRYFIDDYTYDKLDTSESSWYLDDGILHIILVKVSRGTVWEAPLLGRQGSKEQKKEDNISNTVMIDPVMKERMTQALMLERFGEENPGFDFRDAEFNGQVPDPRTFMGGIKYD